MSTRKRGTGVGRTRRRVLRQPDTIMRKKRRNLSLKCTSKRSDSLWSSLEAVVAVHIFDFLFKKDVSSCSLTCKSFRCGADLWWHCRTKDFGTVLFDAAMDFEPEFADNVSNVVPFAFSADGRFVYSARYFSDDKPPILKIWEVKTGEVVARKNVQDPRTDIVGAANNDYEIEGRLDKCGVYHLFISVHDGATFNIRVISERVLDLHPFTLQCIFSPDACHRHEDSPSRAVWDNLCHEFALTPTRMDTPLPAAAVDIIERLQLLTLNHDCQVLPPRTASWSSSHAMPAADQVLILEACLTPPGPRTRSSRGHLPAGTRPGGMGAARRAAVAARAAGPPVDLTHRLVEAVELAVGRPYFAWVDLPFDAQRYDGEFSVSPDGAAVGILVEDLAVRQGLAAPGERHPSMAADHYLFVAYDRRGRRAQRLDVADGRALQHFFLEEQDHGDFIHFSQNHSRACLSLCDPETGISDAVGVWCTQTGKQLAEILRPLALEKNFFGLTADGRYVLLDDDCGLRLIPVDPAPPPTAMAGAKEHEAASTRMRKGKGKARNEDTGAGADSSGAGRAAAGSRCPQAVRGECACQGALVWECPEAVATAARSGHLIVGQKQGPRERVYWHPASTPRLLTAAERLSARAVGSNPLFAPDRTAGGGSSASGSASRDGARTTEELSGEAEGQQLTTRKRRNKKSAEVVQLYSLDHANVTADGTTLLLEYTVLERPASRETRLLLQDADHALQSYGANQGWGEDLAKQMVGAALVFVSLRSGRVLAEHVVRGAAANCFVFGPAGRRLLVNDKGQDPPAAEEGGAEEGANVLGGGVGQGAEEAGEGGAPAAGAGADDAAGRAAAEEEVLALGGLAGDGRQLRGCSLYRVEGVEDSNSSRRGRRRGGEVLVAWGSAALPLPLPQSVGGGREEEPAPDAAAGT